MARWSHGAAVRPHPAGLSSVARVLDLRPRPADRTRMATLTVACSAGVWEVLEDSCVLTWAATEEDAVCEAELLAGGREPCQIVVRRADGTQATLASRWDA